MKAYIVLLRGINVGGKNKIPMTALKDCLEKLGFNNVATYIASGNVILDSDKDVKDIQQEIESALVVNFKLDSKLIKVLVLSQKQLESVVNNKPLDFGEESGKYHSDVIFLMDISTQEAMSVFRPKEGVDSIWPGEGVIYSQRLSALRTKSRLSRIMGKSAYKSMTIRSWGTTERLLSLLYARNEK